MLTWVVGAGGLLGSAVAREVEQPFVGSPVPWDHPSAARRTLEADLARFVSLAGSQDWAVVWAAGSGVIGSSAAALRSETATVQRFVEALARTHPAGAGAFFLASSAGGVYAGSNHPPFDETTSPRPLSAYGEAKIAQEALVTATLGDTLPLVIGRLSNLYGPGQNIGKPQGLVSQLCLAAARRSAVNVFVPMETLRDYLYADDAAVMIVSSVAAAVHEGGTASVVRNLASQRPTPVAGVVRCVQQVARRPIRIALGTSPTASSHVRDLRIVSRFANDPIRVPITPLPVGIKRVYDHTLGVLREGSARQGSLLDLGSVARR